MNMAVCQGFITTPGAIARCCTTDLCNWAPDKMIPCHRSLSFPLNLSPASSQSNMNGVLLLVFFFFLPVCACFQTLQDQFCMMTLDGSRHPCRTFHFSHCCMGFFVFFLSIAKRQRTWLTWCLNWCLFPLIGYVWVTVNEAHHLHITNDLIMHYYPLYRAERSVCSRPMFPPVWPACDSACQFYKLLCVRCSWTGSSESQS